MANVILLRDGRKLGYAEYGFAGGTPVLFFHGTPGSRMMRHPRAEIAESLGVRIIAVDRPGYGMSDIKRPRKLLDWPDDVAELADALGMDRFAVAGFSGGGPHALVCAYKISDRVTSVTLISSVPPFDEGNPELPSFRTIRLLFGAATYVPWILRPAIAPIVYTVRRNFARCFDWAVSKLPSSDSELLSRPEVKSVFRESLGEAFRNGSTAFIEELTMFMRPWGFSPGDLHTRIYLWHGDSDIFHDGRLFAGRLPNCRSTFLPEGHALFFRHWKEILEQLIST